MTTGLNAAIAVLEGRLEDARSISRGLADSEVSRRFFRALDRYTVQVRTECLRGILDRTMRISLPEDESWAGGLSAAEQVIEAEMNEQGSWAL